MSDESQQLEFAQIIEEHRGILFKVANNYCKQKSDRPDLIQEMILQMWRAFPAYDSRASHSTWMYKIAINVAISFYRTHKRHYSKTESLDSLNCDLGLIDESTAQSSDNIELVQQLIRQLDELNRALLLLYLEGFSHAEIAEVMGMSKTNVATKILRLKEQLQREFQSLNAGE